MKLSVVIAAYNEVDFIDRAIESVIHQKNISLDSLEIIVGDDGSSDGTIDKIIAWKKRLPDLFKTFVMERPVSNDGIIASNRVSNLLHRAIALSTGDFICFLAGDDFYCSDHFFEDHLRALTGSANCDCVGAMCDYYRYWTDDNMQIARAPHNKRNKLKASVYWGCHMYIHLSTFVFRNVFKENKVTFEGLDFIDDIGMEFLMGQYGDFKYVPGAMFCYQQRDGSIMRTNDNLDNRLCSMLLYEQIRTNRLNKHRIASYSRIVSNAKSLFNARLTLGDSRYDKYYNKSGNRRTFEKLLPRKDVYLRQKLWHYCILFGLYICYIPFRIIKILFYKEYMEAR